MRSVLLLRALSEWTLPARSFRSTTIVLADVPDLAASALSESQTAQAPRNVVKPNSRRAQGMRADKELLRKQNEENLAKQAAKSREAAERWGDELLQRANLEKLCDVCKRSLTKDFFSAIQWRAPRKKDGTRTRKCIKCCVKLDVKQRLSSVRSAEELFAVSRALAVTGNDSCIGVTRLAKIVAHQHSVCAPHILSWVAEQTTAALDGGCDACHLSWLVHALARIPPFQKVIFERLMNEVEKRFDEFSVEDMQQLIWALATVGLLRTGLLDKMARFFSTRVHMLDARALSTIAWALAKLDHLPPDLLFRDIARQAESRLGDFDAQGLTHMVWAYSRLKVKNRPLLKSIAITAYSRLPDFTPRQLVTMVAPLTQC
jgi:hypothetical protein